MKRTLALAAALALTVAACGDDGPTGPGGGGGNSMAASVDGVQFTPLGVATSATLVDGLLIIQGSNAAGAVIRINLMGVDDVGTYEVNPSFAGSSALYSTINPVATWTTIVSPGGGTVTITTLNDDKVVGNFQFTGQAAAGTAATGQKSITSGTFDIEF